MGSVSRFARPHPLLRHPRAKSTAERETREARRSLFILIGSFFITATVMCAAVVVMVSSTWTDVVIMSAFVLVFALLKIVLANALIYTMLRYDAESGRVPLQREMTRGHPRYASMREAPPPIPVRRPSLQSSKLRVIGGKARPQPANRS